MISCALDSNKHSGMGILWRLLFYVDFSSMHLLLETADGIEVTLAVSDLSLGLWSSVERVVGPSTAAHTKINK